MPANDVRMDDGFSTLITLGNAPTVKLYEKEVTPPGIQGGGPIDTTTMRNIEWRTASPKKLKTASQITLTVAFASGAIPIMRDQVGVNQQITVSFPDGSSLTIWGWVDEFTPGAFTEGEQPTATVTIQPSNHDNAQPPEEVAPLYSGGSGSS